MYIDLHPEMTNGARDGASGNDDQLTTKAERLHNAHSYYKDDYFNSDGPVWLGSWLGTRALERSRRRSWATSTCLPPSLANPGSPSAMAL